MRGEKSKCSLEFYVILSVTIENICKQIIQAAKFAIQLAITNLRKLLDMCTNETFSSTSTRFNPYFGWYKTYKRQHQPK